MTFLKLVAFLGMCLNAVGTILLWKSSPGGYALSGYGSAQLVADNNANNQRMQRKQKIAIGLIVIGVALQLPLLFVG